MTARADGSRATRAANALRLLVAHPGDRQWLANAAKCLGRYTRQPCTTEALAALTQAELVALAERLDRYAESVT